MRNLFLKVLRGIKANIPALGLGEPYLTTDTNELFIGSTPGNVEITIPVFNAAGVRKVSPHIVADKVMLVSGTATVTFPDGAAFTSATSYICVGVDITAKNRTPAITQVSGTQVIFTGQAGDMVQYICVGS